MVKLFLCGDVMTGRGVDQILPYPSEPRLHESWVRSAVRYVELAERRCGAIAKPVDLRYVWGDALARLDRESPDARVVNLETSVTTSDEPWPGKGIHYRMHPGNVGCLGAAGLDCCVLANNHVMDWGRAGLGQTLDTLRQAGLRTAGAGKNAEEAAAPAAIALKDGGRLLVFATAMASSGVPLDWAAGAAQSGVDLLPDFSPRRLRDIAARIERHRRPGDLVVFSIHWGGNWGYGIGREERAFAHGLVEVAGVDVVHGHSSHHAKGIEVFEGRLILYGCGDFLNDYEGIEGFEEAFRPELALMYFPSLHEDSGRLIGLVIVPMRIRHLRVEEAGGEALRWVARMLEREGRDLGTGVETMAGEEGTLALRWK